MLTVSSGNSGVSPIEPGTYPAVCYGLIDLGEQWSEQYEKWNKKVMVMWELPGEIYDTGSGIPASRVISKKYTASINERAALRKDLEAWRGRPFTKEEERAFDLNSIVGAPCLLSIINREYQGSTYANVGGVMKLPKGMPIADPTMEHIVFDLDKSDLDMLDEIPEWIAKQVRESRQYKERTEGKPVPPDLDDLDAGVDDDEEVPF